MRILLKAAFVLGIFHSLPCLAQMRPPSTAFKEADELFAERLDGLQAVNKARSAYEAIYRDATDGDLAYAVQQLGRLAIYEGTHLISESDRRRKARVFDQCRTMVLPLEEFEAHATIYVFWRMTCSSLFMQYASIPQRLGAIRGVRKQFNRVVDDDLEIKPELNLDPRYMGGGIYRILAGIYSNETANMVRSSLPDHEKSFAMIARALASQPFPGSPLWGSDFYSNYTYKARTLGIMGRASEKKETLDSAIEEIQERIEDEDLPQGFEPETIAELSVMRELLD